jgi:hypothetical protein
MKKASVFGHCSPYFLAKLGTKTRKIVVYVYGSHAFKTEVIDYVYAKKLRILSIPFHGDAVPPLHSLRLGRRRAKLAMSAKLHCNLATRLTFNLVQFAKQIRLDIHSPCCLMFALLRLASHRQNCTLCYRIGYPFKGSLQMSLL